MSKQVSDIVYDEFVKKTGVKSIYSKPEQDANLADAAEYPKGIQVGDDVYCYSIGEKAWLFGKVTRICQDRGPSYYIAFTSVEHSRPYGEFYTNRIKYNVDTEISMSRNNYFTKYPYRKRNS